MPPPVNLKGPARVDNYVNSANQASPLTAQNYWSELKPEMQTRIEGMGLNQKLWDDPNSYSAKTLRTQMAGSAKNPNDMRFSNAAAQFKRFANVPQKLAILDNNIGFNRATGAWSSNSNDLAEGAPGYVPPAPAATTPAPSSGPAGMVAAPAVAPASKPSTAPMPKQGSAMTDKQMFKVAFLTKCIEEGLTIDEIKLRVKQALYFSEKKASLEALGNLVRTVPALAAGVAALTAGGGYYGGKHIIGPGIHEAFKAPLPDKEDLLKEEIINEYDRQAETIKRQAELTKRRRERDRGMSGITRY